MLNLSIGIGPQNFLGKKRKYISYVQSQVGEVPRYSFRIQASLLIWLKVVKQTRESLGFFVKLQDILRPQRGGTL
jgi:hypothetical protein